MKNSEFCEVFAQFKFFISFLISDFATLLKENLFLRNRCLTVLMPGWFKNFILPFNTGSSIFTVFINGSMYGGELGLVMTLEKKSFKIFATVWPYIEFPLLLFFHLLLLKWFYLFLQFYWRKVVWQNSRISRYHIVFKYLQSWA